MHEVPENSPRYCPKILCGTKKNLRDNYRKMLENNKVEVHDLNNLVEDPFLNDEILKIPDHLRQIILKYKISYNEGKFVDYKEGLEAEK